MTQAPSRRKYPPPPNPGYTRPLRKREEIASYLAYGTGQPGYSTRHTYNGGHGDWGLFCFDVKVYDLDLSLEHLLELYVANGHSTAEEYWSDERWLDQARQEYATISDGYGWGEEALSNIAIEEARETVNDQDTWKCLWWFGEDASFDAKYDFLGRSGGHMRLATWWSTPQRDQKADWPRLWDFTDGDKETWYHRFLGNPHPKGTKAHDDWFDTWGYSFSWDELRKLYATIRMLEWDFQREKVKAHVEDAACFRLFASYLEEIPDPRLADWQRSESSCGLLTGIRSAW